MARLTPIGNVVREGDPRCKTPMHQVEPGVWRCIRCGHEVDMREPTR